MIKVIIFDLDGLLVDSLPLLYKAYNQVFTKYGCPLSLENWHEWINGSLKPIIWIQKNKLPLDAGAVRLEKKKIYEKLIRDELKLKPGAKNLINILGKKLRLCIASSSRIESVKSIVNKFKLGSKFEELISDAEMEKWKPHPYIFLKTAEIMGVKPNECLVVEDSIAGLKAAKAAGMICIICPDSFSDTKPNEFKGADKIVKNLNEISYKMIESLCSKR